MREEQGENTLLLIYAINLPCRWSFILIDVCLFWLLSFSIKHQDFISSKWYQTSAVTGRISAKHPVSMT